MAITDKFESGETIVCSILVKTTSTSALINPATSMNIDIYDPLNFKTVSSEAMTNDTTGTYHYDYTPVGGVVGVYKVVYTATDGSRITIQEDLFTLVGV